MNNIAFIKYHMMKIYTAYFYIMMLLLRKIVHEYSLCRNHTKLLQHYVAHNAVDMNVNEFKGNEFASFTKHITLEEMWNGRPNSNTLKNMMFILQSLFAYPFQPVMNASSLRSHCWTVNKWYCFTPIWIRFASHR